tara:strand:- start:110 stop:502 length:393 start_codon:yes stop_codon:yes gene_type:complete
MLSILFLLSLSIGLLTLISFKSDSSNKEDLKNTLSLISKDLKSIFKNLKNLLLVVFKDLLNDSQDSIQLSNSIYSEEKAQEEKTNNNTTMNSINSLNQEETSVPKDLDLAINEFSPEVIQIINEEEEKVA